MRSLSNTTLALAFAASLAACDAPDDAPGPPPGREPGDAETADTERAAYVAADHSGAVAGTVRLTGTPPPPEKFLMGTDPVCVDALADGPVFNPKFVVNADGTLPHAFVYAHEGPHDAYAGFAVPDAAEIVQTGCMYHPYVSGILLGQGLWVVNGDDTSHNVHTKARRNKEVNISQPPGGRDAISLTKRERVQFVCDTHSWMQAFCYVVEHPFFAVSDASGNFSIEGLPDGDYVFRVEHPQFGRTEVAASVAAGTPVRLEPSLAAE